MLCHFPCSVIFEKALGSGSVPERAARITLLKFLPVVAGDGGDTGAKQGGNTF
jgi:hypothetical protein